MSRNLNVFIVATEQSGDNLGSSLIKYLKLNSQYNFNFYGIGGDKMIKEGLIITDHISEFKSLGFFEIIKNLKSIFNILNNNVEKAISFKPNLVITIDSPDFSFRFIKKLRKKYLNAKFVHYVAPTVWAWRPGRAKYISNLYDLLLTIFPFEPIYFRKYNLKTIFVGNPICINDYIANKLLKEKKYIAFLPGSRLNEINSLMPYFNILSNHIYKSYNGYKIFIPTLSHLKKHINSQTKKWKIKPIIIDNKKEIEDYLSMTKISIVCSRTASLELIVKKIPIITIYKLNLFTEFLFSFFVKTKFANIINIMAKREIIPELTNHNLTCKKLINKFNLLITNFNEQQKQVIESEKFTRSLCLENNCAHNSSIEILKLFKP